MLYRHCAAEVIGLAKSCLLAENSWEKNRHYCSREKCYFFSTSSTADPAVQYYSISCWERPTVRPKIIMGIQNSPWAFAKALDRPKSVSISAQDLQVPFWFSALLAKSSRNRPFLWLSEVRFEFGHWYAERIEGFFTFTNCAKLLKDKISKYVSVIEF